MFPPACVWHRKSEERTEPLHHPVLEGAFPEAVFSCYKFCFTLYGCAWPPCAAAGPQGLSALVWVSLQGHPSLPCTQRREKYRLKLRDLKFTWALMPA